MGKVPGSFYDKWYFKLFSDHVFQHGNPRRYVARVCQDFLNQNHTRFLLWPTLSPDQSTIAHLTTIYKT
jgi:hypothetical protein